ncbi:disulfide oxidoreductase [Salinithrix halophila]|uniref:Disulfide oxidoreductase n=1 Tax=Salinithrix halophila TaxID=1485204 RepID=A0ABV8JFY3_9BACL
MTGLRNYSLYLAWLVSLVAVGGSLYFSEYAGYIPCQLCWIQRIFMYPLVLILGIASYREDRSVIPYALSMSLLGGSVSLYHYLHQMVPGLASLAPCREGVPCNTAYIDWLGFITIPLLALAAFTLISVLLFLERKRVE